MSQYGFITPSYYSPVAKFNTKRKKIENLFFSLSSLNPSLWLDASKDMSITTVDGLVNEWRDLSTNNLNATQVTSSLRPSISLNSRNNRDTISLTQDQLDFPAVSFTGNEYHWFTVVNMQNTSNQFARLISMRGVEQVNDFNNTASWIPILRNSSNNQVMGQFNSNEYGIYTINYGQYYLIQSSLLATGIQFYVDTVLRGSFNGTINLNVNQIRIGQSLNGAHDENWDGNLAEVILIRGTLSQNNKELIEGYLAWKWGMVSILPTSHPYKNKEVLF